MAVLASLPLEDLRERRRLRKLRTGDTPQKLAEDARRARQPPPPLIRSSAEPALRTAIVFWLWRGPAR